MSALDHKNYLSFLTLSLIQKKIGVFFPFLLHNELQGSLKSGCLYENAFFKIGTINKSFLNLSIFQTTDKWLILLYFDLSIHFYPMKRIIKRKLISIKQNKTSFFSCSNFLDFNKLAQVCYGNRSILRLKRIKHSNFARIKYLKHIIL